MMSSKWTKRSATRSGKRFFKKYLHSPKRNLGEAWTRPAIHTKRLCGAFLCTERGERETERHICLTIRSLTLPFCEKRSLAPVWGTTADSLPSGDTMEANGKPMDLHRMDTSGTRLESTQSYIIEFAGIRCTSCSLQCGLSVRLTNCFAECLPEWFRRFKFFR